MPVASDRDEAADVMFAYEVIDLAALQISGAGITTAPTRVTPSRPRLRHSSWQILRVRAHIERCSCAAPDLPGRSRRAQPLQEPGLLFSPEDGLPRLILCEIGHVA